MLKITATGNLGRDPEFKSSEGQTDVAVFSLASSNSKDETTWLRCTVFGKRAATVMQFFKKGSRVAVHGKGKLNTYTTNSGEQRTTLELNVQDFDLPERKESEQSTFNNDDNF